MNYAIGDAVKIKFSTMTGTISGAKLDEVSLQIQYLVEYTNNEGVPSARYFKADQIEPA